MLKLSWMKCLILKKPFGRRRLKLTSVSMVIGTPSFFHRYAKLKRNTNLISSFNIDGVITTDMDTIESLASSHYKKLFNREDVFLHNDLVIETITRLIFE